MANVLVGMGDWEGARRHLAGLRVGLGEGLDGREEDELLRGRVALVGFRMGDLRGASEVLGLTKDKEREKGKGVRGVGKKKAEKGDIQGGDEDESAESEDLEGDVHDIEGEEEDPAAQSSTYTEALTPLLSLASGSFATAKDQLSTSLLPSVLAKTNQAVVALYSGHLNQARDLLEELVAEATKSGGEGGGGAGGGCIPSAVIFNLGTCYELLTDRARGLKLELAEKVAGLEGNGREGWERGGGEFKL